MANLFRFHQKNFFAFLIVSIYIIIELSMITWGIPGVDHPFPYHMDEWHQLEFVRNVFKHGTSDTTGVTQIPIFQFITTGIFLVPFVLTHYINPSLIDSSIAALGEQHKLFVVLRLYTLFLGVVTVITVSYIAEKQFRTKTLAALLLTFTPIWLSLSNYFKYDIALLFWISISLLFILRLRENNKFVDYILAGGAVGLAMGVKISSYPMLLLLLISFVVFERLTNVKKIIAGLAAFLLVFIALGIPDILVRGQSYIIFFSRITNELSQAHNGLVLPLPLIPYILLRQLPTSFGYVFFAIFVFSFIFQSVSQIRNFLNRKKIDRSVFILVVGVLVFSISLASLKLEAGSNRILVLLPFFALLGSVTISDMLKKKMIKKVFLIILVLLVFVQSFQSFAWVIMRLGNIPQQEASSWILGNVDRGSIIGIENIPIYQLLPDLIIKEYYQTLYKTKDSKNFKYEIVSSKSSSMPKTVVVTNDIIFRDYVTKNEKRDLLKRLEKERYIKVAVFRPNTSIFQFFGSDVDYYLSGLFAAPITTSIYKQNSITR